MADLLTAAQMRAVEKAAIDSGAVTGLELMERAGQGVVDAAFAEWPELAEGRRRAVVLCGPGNNGGDGFVVARLLKQRGFEVEVFLYGDPGRLPPDARTNCDRWQELGRLSEIGRLKEGVQADLRIDALFGTGLTRPLEPEAVSLGHCMAGPRRVAVDAPSGLCLDSGRPLVTGGEPSFRADLTVSFHTAKTGHYLGAGPELCGRLAVADIGLDRQQDAAVRLVDAATLRGARLDKASGHKFSHGHALILSGGPGRTGAARLAARGALRVGAGLVTLGVPPAAQLEVAAQVTAIMLRRIEDGLALAKVLEDDRLNALCLGPGLGLDEQARGMVAAALDAGRATVLDADALTLVAQDDGLFARLHAGCVLTPHGGEFARLFPDIAEMLAEPPTRGPAFSKVDATRAAAARAGCTVLCKGPDTVIAAPDGQAAVNASVYDRAAPWLATAGSGDVLAGFIAGLLARGFAPMQAAETGAWLHTECAVGFGPGLIAEDLPEHLPRVLLSLGR